MSQRTSDVPFVIGSDGILYLNVINMFAGAPNLHKLLSLGGTEKGRLLVAVELDSREAHALLRRLQHGASEAAAYAAGTRARRRRRRDQR